MGRRGREGQGREGVEERKVGGVTPCIYRRRRSDPVAMVCV